jgi:large subunit ribosomal protein L9
MKVILKETIDSLGIIGSEVTVADGYARNYLLPQDKAVLATSANRIMLKQQKVKFDLQIAKEKGIAQEMAQKLEEVVCSVSAKVSDADRLYGSITIRDIVDSLAREGINVEKRMILMTEPIKKIGAYKVPVRVYKEVETEITLQVVPE